jgi:acetylornithine deacetylase/succinyl-diaminopimelate desuccinylase-like protein
VEGNGLRERVHDQMARVRADLTRLVSLRCAADALQRPADTAAAQRLDCAKAAQWVLEAFAETGMRDLRLLPTHAGGQAVYGQRPGPAGAPTVLLHAHPCRGNIMMHLTALRALGDKVPVSLKLIVDGAPQLRADGLTAVMAAVMAADPDLLRADAILICDAGNVAVGVPAVTTSLRGVANVVVTASALSAPVHSGRFGGPTPDALAALIQMLATLRDVKGNTTVRGLYSGQKWTGAEYRGERLRHDAQVLEGVQLLGDGTPADMVWARPAVTILGIDCPAVDGSTAAIQPTARARINLRVPPGMDQSKAQNALVHHLEAVAPWAVRVECEREPLGAPFRAVTDGPAYSALGEAHA